MRENLFIARKRKRYSQAQIAKILEIGLSTYRRIELGGDIGVELGQKICGILEESFEHLFLS
jgi:transcriptional regulator with XRE-family HTH domain